TTEAVAQLHGKHSVLWSQNSDEGCGHGQFRFRIKLASWEGMLVIAFPYSADIHNLTIVRRCELLPGVQCLLEARAAHLRRVHFQIGLSQDLAVAAPSPSGQAAYC